VRYCIEGKFGAGLNLTNLMIAKIHQFFPSQIFILAHDHPHGEYEKEGSAEPPLDC